MTNAFNFHPMIPSEGAVTKTDLPYGISLMSYIAHEPEEYKPEDLLGDDWEFVRAPCCGYKDNPRFEEVTKRLGLCSDGSPDLECLLDKYPDVVLKNATFFTNSSDLSELLPNEKIEWLRSNLYSDSRITQLLQELWDTGLVRDPKVVLLDVYSHSGEDWSFTGEGVQCKWDTAVCAGALLPSEDMCELLDELAKTDPRDMKTIARENASDYLKGFNLWNTGSVYQIVGELVDTASGQEITNDVFPTVFGGYLGFDHAEENFEEQRASMEASASEVVAARNLAWLENLQQVGSKILEALDIEKPGPLSKIVDILAANLQPPKDFSTPAVGSTTTIERP